MAHNFYLIPGGEDQSFHAEMRMLTEAGHTVIPYAISNEQIESMSTIAKATTAMWSPRTHRDVQRLLRQSNADVLHVQNFFPLISPSIYYAAKSQGVPVVQSLRNYRLLCPNGQFFRNGHPCEDCLGRRVQLPGVVHGCYRNDRAATAAVATMNASHRLAGTWSRRVQMYVTLTEFARQKYIEGGWPSDRLVVKPNFIHPDPGPAEGHRHGVVFVGRLSPEKGLGTLLSAWEQLGPQGISLKIIGEGPLKGMVEDRAARIPEITYLGPRTQAEMLDIVGESETLIVPSEWYETFGRVVIEAYAKGTPVVASQIGALSEIVHHGQTGLLYEPGNVEQLIGSVRRITGDRDESRRMGLAARFLYEDRYTAGHNIDQLVAIYARAQSLVSSGAHPEMPTADESSEFQGQQSHGSMQG